jgi:hypothetical protein
VSAVGGSLSLVPAGDAPGFRLVATVPGPSASPSLVSPSAAAAGLRCSLDYSLP